VDDSRPGATESSKMVTLITSVAFSAVLSVLLLITVITLLLLCRKRLNAKTTQQSGIDITTMKDFSEANQEKI